MELHRDLERVIAVTGAAAANTASSSATVNRGLQTRLAWELRDSISAVEKGHGPGLVFRTRRRALAGEVAVSGHARSSVELARLGAWTVYRREEVGTRALRDVCREFTFASQGAGTRPTG